jgi:hypothetical protein
LTRASRRSAESNRTSRPFRKSVRSSAPSA